MVEPKAGAMELWSHGILENETQGFREEQEEETHSQLEMLRRCNPGGERMHDNVENISGDHQTRAECTSKSMLQNLCNHDHRVSRNDNAAETASQRNGE